MSLSPTPAGRPSGPSDPAGKPALDWRVAAAVSGTVAAVLGAAPLTGIPLAAALSVFSAVPIFHVGFSRGPAAAAVAAAVAVIATAAVGGPVAGLLLGATTVVPAAYAAYLVNLARPADELGGPGGQLAWFPLADVLLRLCLTVAAGSVVAGIAIGYDGEALRVAFAEMLRQAVDTPGALPGGVPPGFDPDLIAARVANLLPAAQAFGSVLVLMGCMHIAMRAARARGALRRPADDMALALRMPALGLAAFALALILSVSGDGAAPAARAFAGALGAGYVIAGFALVHSKLRGNAAGPPLLIALYLLTLLTAGATLPVMVGVGLFSTVRAVPISKPND